MSLELRVWTGRVERVISNADDETTCRDVIITLAAITKITGCYTLIGQHVDSHLEVLLTPSDKPLRLLKEQKQRGQPPLRFLLRHSKRTHPITQLIYHERTRNKSDGSAADHLYNREALRSRLVDLMRRNTSISAPAHWRKQAKKVKTRERVESRCNESSAAPAGSGHQQIPTQLESSTAELGRRRESVWKMNNSNNNNNNSNSTQPQSDPLELILYLTETNVYATGNTRSKDSAAANTFESVATPSSEYAPSGSSKTGHAHQHVTEVTKELNSMFVNRAGKQAARRKPSAEIYLSKSHPNDENCEHDSLERMVYDNTFAESELELSKPNKLIPPLKLPASEEVRTCMDVIDSLDDFLDREGQNRIKKMPKKLAIGSPSTFTKTETGANLTYRQKLNKFRSMEKGEKLADDLAGRRSKTNKDLNGGITDLSNEYADHVDSEIKDLKIGVEQNEMAAKKLEDSIKEMQTNFNDVYDHKPPNTRSKEFITAGQIIENKEILKNETSDTFFYPTEHFPTLAKPLNLLLANTESDNDNVFESGLRINVSDSSTNSLNQEFLILLEDNRKGYLV